MKVSKISHASVISVNPDTPLKEVARLIFSLGIAGIPVVKGTKLVGIITEQDILSKMYPSIQDLDEDYIHARNFDEMEKNLLSLLETPVKDLMNTHVISIKEDAHVMEAQALILLHKFSRLPIVDANKNLIGLVSQGDIFRYIVRNQIPALEKERYAGFIATRYDDMVNWKRRFSNEFPTLRNLFTDEKIEKVVDVGSWTGEYTIRLAKEQVKKVLGLDHNSIMIKVSNDKLAKLSPEIRERTKFMLTDFTDLDKRFQEKFDAAVCMGNSLPYFPVSLDQIISGVHSGLKKNGLFIIQLLNFEKILNKRERLLSFQIEKCTERHEQEHLFMEFFDFVNKDSLTHHVVVFDSDRKNWIYKGITSIEIKHITKEDLEKRLKKNGFHDIKISGTVADQGDYGKLSFDEPFDHLGSDWINIIARS